MTAPRRHRALRALTWFVLLELGLLAPTRSWFAADVSAAKSHDVRYVLEWKRSKARDLPHGGWEIVNDLGFTVHLTRAYLVSRSLELIPCDPVAPAASLRGLQMLVGPGPAYAGHSTIADPSATKNAQVEGLLQPTSLAIAPIPLAAQTYCHVHYLIARADPQSAGFPSDVDMVDQTLRFEGTFQRPGSSAPEPFSITTAVANGKLFELTTAPSGRIDTGNASAAIIVRRNLDTLFDRVDFASMPEKRVARELLQNLIDGSEIEVRVERDAS